MSSSRFKRHQRARAKLDELFSQPEKVYVIHYSCESFYDRPDGSSPRITAIAVRNLASGQTVSFSIHQIGELKGIGIGDIHAKYNDLEKEMLDRFADYLKSHTDVTWLHWNMRDSAYGFQAIEHRHRVLGGEPYVVPDDRKTDLARLFTQLYGSKYVADPRMESLLELNGMSKRHFLTGAEEAAAFEEKRYVDLHRSTVKKVDVLCHFAQDAYDGVLKTNSSWYKARGLSLEAILALIQEHPIHTILSLLGTVGSIIGIWCLIN